MYLMYFMLTTTLSVIFSTFVLKLHYWGHEVRAPHWLRVLTFDLLAPLLCLHSITRWNRQQTKEGNQGIHDKKASLSEGVISESVKANGDVSREVGTNCNHIAATNEAFNNRAGSRLSLSMTRTLSLELAVGEEGAKPGAISATSSGRKLDPISEEWKKISEVVDRLLFWLFLIFLMLPLVSLIAFVRSPRASY